MRADEAVKAKARHIDRLYMRVVLQNAELMEMAAGTALAEARYHCPKLTGIAANQLQPIWGDDYFGIRWIHKRVWFQEMGIKPFVMKSLEGKTIPMWVEDRDGKLRKSNPEIKTKQAADGRQLYLIFRKAAIKPHRKQVKRKVNGIERWVSVPKSYPGAPGRIVKRGAGAPIGKKGGQILKGNGGVRWRYPGMASKFFIHNGLLMGARQMGFEVGDIQVAEEGDRI